MESFYYFRFRRDLTTLSDCRFLYNLSAESENFLNSSHLTEQKVTPELRNEAQKNFEIQLSIPPKFRINS